MSVTKQIVEPLLSFVTKVSSTLFIGYLEVKGTMPRVDNDLTYINIGLTYRIKCLKTNPCTNILCY